MAGGSPTQQPPGRAAMPVTRPSGMVTEVPPGSRVAGYEIMRLVGVGGMAAVYQARDVQLGRVVALKLPAGDEAAVVRFVREARAVAAVDHPHIIPVYAAGEASDGTQYIAMRFVPGGTSIRDDLPPAVDEVILRAMAKNPDHRYQTCADFGDALRAALGFDPYDPSRAVPVPTLPMSMLDQVQPPVPPQAQPVSVTWTAVIAADRDYYEHIQAVNDADAKRITFPDNIPERRVPLAGEELLIGRRSVSENVSPDIDLIGPPMDPGIHRKHAKLVPALDGGWLVVDLGMENGIMVNGRDVPAGGSVPLDPGDYIHLGAWTRITITRG